ncbi:hypothetical protein [Paraflavitalea speifideaquila]|uniref:hypothetical protein n=1 Tax=Paraflavitalea speifideaquila TaxID=3076558 RepID=UPI0028EB462B|nr:hypothetical protein [Paraflavitalea speifideiaquila]
MRRYFLPLTGLAALLLILNQPVAAQDDKSGEKAKTRSSNMMRSSSAKRVIRMAR